MNASSLAGILPIAQIAVSVCLIVLVLLQERSSGASGIFGGGGGEFYQTRRGLERGTYVATIVLMAVFAFLALLDLVV